MPHCTGKPVSFVLPYLFVLSLLSAVNGCAILPAQLPHNEVEYQCEMVTHRWDLRTAAITNVQCNKPECLSLIIVVPVVTGISSGVFISIANTVHWLETVSRCN